MLFVTVDPERDTPEVLGKYVAAFDPRFLGLLRRRRGHARAAKEFKVYYEKHGKTADGVQRRSQRADLRVRPAGPAAPLRATADRLRRTISPH